MRNFVFGIVLTISASHAQAITAPQCFTSLANAGRAILGFSVPEAVQAPTPAFKGTPEVDLTRTLGERAEVLKARSAQKGADLLATVKNGVLEVDAILIGGGIFTSLFAANFNGRMIVIEKTKEAGNFDRLAEGLRVNSPETETKTGNPLPGSPVTLKDVMAASSDKGGVQSDGKYGNGRELGNAGVEALDYSGAPVWFGTEARPFEVERDGRVSVMASNGIKVIGKYGIIGGQGAPRIGIENRPSPESLRMILNGIVDPTNYQAGSKPDRTREIYEGDRRAQSARPRIMTSDEILGSQNLPELVDGKTIVVTGDKHGAMSAIMKLTGKDPGKTQAKPKRIIWIGNLVEVIAEHERETYRPVIEGIRSGLIVPVTGRVVGTEPGDSPNTVNVRYFTQGVERVQEVDLNVVALGYAPMDMSFLGQSAVEASKGGGTTVSAPLPPMTGVDVKGEVPVSLNIANVYPVGPRLLMFAARGFPIPKEIVSGKIGTVLDLVGRQAAALGQLLSPNKPLPVNVSNTTYKSPTPAPTANGLRPEFAVLDVKKTVGRILANMQFNKNSGNIEVKFGLNQGILEVRAPIANSLDFAHLVSDSNFVGTLLNLGSQVTVTIPVVNGRAVLHAMTVGTRY